VTVPSRGFTTAEFANRCKAAQHAMAKRDIAALLLTSEADVRYFTGFMTQFWQSPTRPWFVLLPDSGRPIAVIPSIGAPLMRDCYVGDLRLWASPAETDDGISLLAEVIHDHVSNSNRLGMMMGRETSIRMPFADIEILQAQLNGVTLADMTADIQQIRMIKSPAEQEKLKYICGTVSRVFETIPSWVAAGMPLDELFRQFKIRALKAGVDDVSYLVGSAGPDGYRDIIAPPSNRPLTSGDVFMLDTGCVWDGYFSDFDRNFAIHHASDAAKEAHHRLFDATEAALDILKPGITAYDLFSVMDNVLRPEQSAQMGGDEVGRYGHGLGIQLTEPPSHTNWDKTVIKSGMALTIEPSITYGDGLTMVAEENLLILDDGFVLMSARASRDLPVIHAP
jgi:Xaa-Pro dipeptidase